jgi:hypothetical protein
MTNKYSIVLLNALPDKKIKSLGNKCLIKINKKYTLIDYQIDFFNSIFDNPEIIIVGGFDGKRLKKYIDNHLADINIKYVEHAVDDGTNIGTSLAVAKKLISHKNCLIINSSLLLYSSIRSLLLDNLNSSFLFVHNTDKNKNEVGYIQNNNKLINCYYGLPNIIFDCLYINSYDIEKFLNICGSNIQRYYLFEIINKCIEHDISIKPINITKKSILSIDSTNSIKHIRDKLCIK